MRYPTTLTIAGSDSGGGAGIQADLKAFSALGTFGMSVITAITAQNTREVREVEALSTHIIRAQLEAVLDDFTVDAIKTGMLVTPEIIELVGNIIAHYGVKNIVIDPVMVATTGANLTKADLRKAYHEHLYNKLTLLTPNIPEAETLTGLTIHSEADKDEAGAMLIAQGCGAVLIKGGHLKGNNESIDTLYCASGETHHFASTFINTPNTHGTGCSLGSAIAAYLAKGEDLVNAIQLAKKYITEAIRCGAEVNFNGNGPLNHFFSPQPLKPTK